MRDATGVSEVGECALVARGAVNAEVVGVAAVDC